MYLLKVVVLISLGVTLANIALEAGVLSYLARSFRPVFQAANISPEQGTGAMARVLSPSAGYSSLAEFYKSGRIEERGVIITTFLTSLPYELLRIFKFYLPVAVPLMGLSLGSKYIAVKVGSGFLQTVLALLYSRLKLPRAAGYRRSQKEKPDYRRALKNSLSTLFKVVPLFILTYLGIRLLLTQGLLSPLTGLAEPLTGTFSLPGEASLVVVTMFANVIAGFAAAGELLRQGLLSEEQALITLIAGLVLSMPRIFLQHTAPVVASLFSKRVAAKIVLFKISVETVALLAMLGLVVRWS